MKSIIIIILLISLGGCMSNKPYCPTYADSDDFVAPIEEKTDTTSMHNGGKIVLGIMAYVALNTLIYTAQDGEDGKVGEGFQIMVPLVTGLMIYGTVNYIHQSRALSRNYKYLIDSLRNNTPINPNTGRISKVDRREIRRLADSLHTPMLKQYGFYME